MKTDLTSVLIGCLIFGAISAPNMLLIEAGVYSWRVGQFVFMVINFITFVMAFVALGRRGK